MDLELGWDPAKGHDVFLHRWYFSGSLGASVRRVFLLFSVFCLSWFHGFHGKAAVSSGVTCGMVKAHLAA